MRLEQLYYITEIAKTNSISMAAENLFITQPTLSIAISTLEKELGIKLFERTKSGVYPTGHGQEVIRLAYEMLAKMEEIQRVGLKSVEGESLNILTIPSINCGILQQALINFNQLYPHVTTFIREEKPGVALSIFVKNLNTTPRYLGLCSITEVVWISQENWLQSMHISREFLASDEMVCLVSAQHPLAEKTVITRDDCRKFPLIKYQFIPSNAASFANDPLSSISNPTIFTSFYDHNIILTVSTLESLKKLVSENVGISIMPACIGFGDPLYENGSIKMLRFSDVAMPLRYYFLYNNQLPLTPIELAFIEQIKGVFQCFHESHR